MSYGVVWFKRDLRLLLGDQLNPLHPWFATVDSGVIYVLMVHDNIQHFGYQSPDEYRLAQQLQAFCASSACQISVSSYETDSNHFYTQRHEAAALFANRKQGLLTPAAFFSYSGERLPW